MWWKESCYNRFIIAFLTIIAYLPLLAKANFGSEFRKRTLNSNESISCQINHGSLDPEF